MRKSLSPGLHIERFIEENQEKLLENKKKSFLLRKRFGSPMNLRGN